MMTDSDAPRPKLIIELEKTKDFDRLVADYKKSREAPPPTSAPTTTAPPKK